MASKKTDKDLDYGKLLKKYNDLVKRTGKMATAKKAKGKGRVTDKDAILVKGRKSKKGKK